MKSAATSTARTPVLYAPGGSRPLSPAAVLAHRRAEAGARAAAHKGPSAQRERAKVGSHAILILPDMHHPHADPEAMAVVDAVAAALRPARIVSLGDSIEAAAFSAHPARSVAEQAIHEFADELETCAAAIDRIRAHAGSPPWHYLYGNHEQHVERECLRLGAIGMAVRSMIEPSVVLGRGRPWLTFTPYIEPYLQARRAPSHLRSGGMAHDKITRDLWAIHGWSIAKNAAQRHLDMAKTVSIVHGHTHRQQHVTSRILETDRIIHAWSPGCLSNMQPAWHHSSPTEWAHGLSIVYAADDCMTSATPRWTHYTVTIDRGEAVLPGGTKVAA